HQNWFDFGSAWANAGLVSTTGNATITKAANMGITDLRIKINLRKRNISLGIHNESPMNHVIDGLHEDHTDTAKVICKID
ncbi:MAG: hypothetical protein WBS20_02185, partial [Lysobacterales bacterium]